MQLSQALEGLRHLAWSPPTPAAAYEARRLLEAISLPAERAEAERYLLNTWGYAPDFTLKRLIERHAFALVLGGIDLDEPRYRQGPFTFHVYVSDPVRNGEALGEALRVLPEPGRRRDLKALLREIPRDAWLRLLDDVEEEELDEILPLHTLRGEEREDALTDFGLYDLLDPWGTVYPCVIRTNTLEELLREVRRLGVVAWFQDEEPHPALSLSPREAHLEAIEDPELLAFARELFGDVQMMGMSDDLGALYYCRHILLRRPGAELLFGWDAIPHRQEEGWAILRWGLDV